MDYHECTAVHTDPSLELILEGVLLAQLAILVARLLHLRLTLIHLGDGCDEACTAASLTLIAVGVAVVLVVTDEVGGIGQGNHHLSTQSYSLVSLIDSLLIVHLTQI